MRLLVVGCNHRSAPVEKRELIAFDERQVPCALEKLTTRFPQAEAVLLSTCNRMELYVARPMQSPPRIEELVQFIAEFHDVPASRFTDALYTYEDIQAMRHLFRVVSSLDSMVLGESQILGQARTSFEVARRAGTSGKTLDSLFQRALSTAKNIHTTTGIASGRLSVGSTAVDLARQIFSHFDDKTVLMVGAGKMGELTLTHLLTTQPRRLWVTNRTDARAVELAEKLSQRHPIRTEPVPYAEWIDRLAEVDIVISCTGSHEPILTPENFKPIPARRNYRPLLLIDIALPRDIDPATADVDECVFLYNIDDLQSVTEANLAQRREAIAQCNEIIEAAVLDCLDRQTRQDVGPLIGALQRHFREVSRAEFERIQPKLSDLTDHDRELLAQMLHRVVQKLLHDPVNILNSDPAAAATQVYADTLRKLFNLDTDQQTGSPDLPPKES